MSTSPVRQRLADLLCTRGTSTRMGLIAIVMLIGGAYLFSQETQSQNNRKLPVRVHGFALGSYTARTGEAHPSGKEGGRFLWADERLRLEISADTETGNLSFLFKGDLFHDAVANQLDGVVREAYLDYSQERFELRLGRQIVTWGAGDLLFINDVFPKDWGAFFSGRPLEYLKVGVDAARLHVEMPVLNAELIVTPFFKPDHLPGAERFFFFDPLAGVRNRSLQEPAPRAGNSEFALRLYGRILQSDVSFYAYRGYWRQPSFRPDRFPFPTQAAGFFPRLAVYGASAQRNVGAALLSLEAGYYDSQDDRRGADPVIVNSQARYLVGYQQQLSGELTVGAQYYAELILDYQNYKSTLPAGFPLQDRIRHLLTLRLTKFLKYQSWKLSFFGFYSPSDQDVLLIPEVWHALTDRLSLTVGANLFEGRRATTFLAQFDRNDNLYVAVRVDF